MQNIKFVRYLKIIFSMQVFYLFYHNNELHNDNCIKRIISMLQYRSSTVYLFMDVLLSLVSICYLKSISVYHKLKKVLGE